MEQVHVTLPTRPKTDLTGKDWKLLDKEYFRELVFQAYFYHDSSLTINNVTVAKREVIITIGDKPRRLNEGNFENVLNYLWDRLHYPASNIMHFKSAFEDVEYVIHKL